MPPEADSAQVVDGFLGAVRSLAADANYKMVSEVFTEVLYLKDENSRLTKSHREILDQYRHFRNELEAHEAMLVSEKQGLQETVSQKDQELNDLSEAKAKVETELSEMTEAKCKVDSDLAENQTKLADLETAKAAVEAELASTAAQLADIESAKASVDGQLADANAKLEELDAAHTELKNTLDEVNTKLAEEQQKLEDSTKEVANLQESLGETTAQLEKLKEDFKELEVKESEASDTVVKLRSTLEDVEQELDVKTTTLAELDGYRVPLLIEPEDTYVSILDTIWTSIFEVVETHFRHDLEDKVLSDSSCWTNLRSSSYLKGPTQIPIPQSNSAAAKAMRVAAILTVLSRTLHKHIFRPVYLLDEDTELTHLLREAEHDKPEQESHLRAALLALLPDRQQASAKKRVEAVVREVSWVVQHLLGPIAFDKFCTGLSHACALACTQWRRIQLAQMKIEPYFGPPYDEFDWQMLPLADLDELDAKRNRHGAQSPGGSDTAVEDHPDDDDSGKAVGDANDPAATSTKPDPDTDQAVDDTPEDLATPAVESTAIHDTVGGAEREGDAEEVDVASILMVVWPTMCAVEGGELQSITQGLIMTKEQAARAFIEVRTRHGPRPNQKRARTMSIPSLAALSRKGSPEPQKGFIIPPPALIVDGDG